MLHTDEFSQGALKLIRMAPNRSRIHPVVLFLVLGFAASGAIAQATNASRAEERAEAQRLARELRELEAEVRRREAQAKAAERASAQAETKARAKVEAEVRAAEAARAAAEKREKEEAALRIAPFAALAVGTEVIHHGWARDADSLAAAEKLAIQNCERAGKNCSVVLAWSGNGCGTYRSSKDGDVYGWGTARLINEAASAAFDDASRRSKGRASSNIVQTCNTRKTSAPLEVLVRKPANIGGPGACLLQYEVNFEDQRGDWVGRFYSPVYQLEGADCPRKVGDGEFDVYFKAVPGSRSSTEEAMKLDPSGKGLRMAEEFRAWLATKRSPVAGTVMRNIGDATTTKVTPKAMKELVENVSILDAGMDKSVLRRVFPLCFDFKPAGVTPVATHGAEHCRTWIR